MTVGTRFFINGRTSPGFTFSWMDDRLYEHQIILRIILGKLWHQVAWWGKMLLEVVWWLDSILLGNTFLSFMLMVLCVPPTSIALKIGCATSWHWSFTMTVASCPAMLCMLCKKVSGIWKLHCVLSRSQSIENLTFFLTNQLTLQNLHYIADKLKNLLTSCTRSQRFKDLIESVWLG